MKETEGLYRAVQLVKRTVLTLLVLTLGVVIAGYLFLVRQVDASAAWREAARELRAGVLHYGETPERTARVYQRRPSNYFRATNGLLVATRERLLYVGVEPRDQLAGPDAPASLVTSALPNDTLLALRRRRLYFLTAPGVWAHRLQQTETFAAARGHSAELDSLVAFVRRSHARQRAAAAAERRLRAELARLLREPLSYRVARGDALSTIATRFGASIDDVRRWNHLPSNKVRLGDTLLVKPAGLVPPPFPIPDAAASLAPDSTVRDTVPVSRPAGAGRGGRPAATRPRPRHIR